MSNAPAIPSPTSLGYRGRDIFLAKSVFPALSDRQLLELFTVGARMGLNPALGHLAWIGGKPFVTREGLRVISGREIIIFDKIQEWGDEEHWWDRPLPISQYARCTLAYTERGSLDPEATRKAVSTVALVEFCPESPKPNSPWSKFPLFMLSKIAEVNCLREAIAKSMGGVYSTDEAPMIVPDYEGEPVDEMNGDEDV